jgi:sarcosine oxidase delta subunit
MYQYELEPYQGPRSRGKCPSCGKANEFAFYIDSETKEHLPEHVGRCNRENACGYHYTAGQYMKENGIKTEAYLLSNVKVEEPTSERIDLMPLTYVEKSIASFEQTNIYSFLSDLFGDEITKAACLKYLVGGSNEDNGKASIFWQIDQEQRVRTGKIMVYDAATGKRSKEVKPKWVHSWLKEFSFKQCFFGEHLLSEYPNKVVAIVESEKTAILASIYMPAMVWIATGGTNGCKWREYSVHSVLKDREVILFPDFGWYNKKAERTCYAEWKERADAIQERMSCKMKISRVLENALPEEKRTDGEDLADYLVKRNNGKGWAMSDAIEGEGSYPIFWDLYKQAS